MSPLATRPYTRTAPTAEGTVPLDPRTGVRGQTARAARPAVPPGRAGADAPPLSGPRAAVDGESGDDGLTAGSRTAVPPSSSWERRS
ncbi:hypothetical protein [Streptomyces nitrosporeus]|uniref:hypothetical protein n=1 Tax=Streptomyces nitrosporeus TaxID=28894 RepID=UPI0039A36DAA